MLIKFQNLRHLVLGMGLALMVGQPAMADDTEIFVGRALDAGQANVLFVIDTSGSMGSRVDWEVPYDATNTYDGGCDSDRVYWSIAGEGQPSCDVKDWVYDSVFVCQEAWNAFSASGFYTDNMAQFDSGRDSWDDLQDKKYDRMVECAADNGRHGDGTSTIEVYAAENLDAPFSIVPSGLNNIDWTTYEQKTVYSGNYLNYYNNPSNYELNRLDVVKRVTRDTLNQVSGINIGMMRFDSYSNGGMVTRPVSSIFDEFEPMTSALDNYRHGGGTPLSETMYEATQYLMGRAVDYGAGARGNYGSLEPSASSVVNNGNYVSPIQNACQKNFVVLLTDGEPTSDTGANTRIAELPGFEDATGALACTGNCLDEISTYLHNHDLSSTLDGDQTADVFTIGFHTQQTLLENAAAGGGGEYYTADSADQLRTALTEIFENIIERDTTFTAPAVAVNTFNRLTHRDELFVSMFRPSNNPHWPGNVKRYRLDNNRGTKVIYDVSDRPAINPATGTFYSDAKSFWTIGDPDGYDTTLGGFANRLHADRNVYTVTSGATSNVTLSAAANRVHENNPALTSTLLGVTEAQRSGLIRWARGIDDSDQPLNILGDALHSRPVVLSWGGSEADPDLTLFYATNDGYLHAVDPTADTTENMEVFSFIPGDLLPRLNNLRANNRNNPPKFYGLDGQISYLILGDNGNRVIDDGERAFLYIGMRRGGKNYYAIEVTDRNNPKLVWTVEGGQGQFTELGQTWSEMTPSKVRIDGSLRDVLIFGGGYDTRQDAAGANVADNEGRAIYMVDAVTGNRLWWAGNSADNPSANLALSNMTNSIPSNVRVIDMNGDGADDRLYVGDMTGQMWRFDIDNEATTMADLVSGGVIADIGAGDASGNRRIFYPPSVSLFSDEWLGSFLAVAFGTGHRANPLGTTGRTVTDRFYMLRDPYVFAPYSNVDGDAVYTAANSGDFRDVTNDLDPSVTDLNNKKGWSITLDNEEKVLSSSLTADGRIFFTSYRPDADGELTCNPSGALGSARAYSVAIGSGAPRLIGDPHDTPEDPDPPLCEGRCTRTQGPIPPEPILVFTEPPPPCDPAVEVCCDPATEICDDDACDGIADAALIIGTDVLDPAICTAPVRTYWFADGDT